MSNPHLTPTSTPFGTLPDGTQATLFTLRNEFLDVTLTDYGARLVSLHAPDRTGTPTNVVLGLTAPTPYTAGRNFYMGATAGRYANRIAQGRFTLEGVQVEIPANNGPNALHGGPQGFDARLWTAHIAESSPDNSDNAVTFTLISPDGDQGFPGTLTVSVTYTLTASALHITYTATTDRTTVLNLTNHAYFNLAGESSNTTILDHVLQLNASAFTPVDETIIPTGELAPVAGTPFDFQTPHPIGERIDEDHPQLARAGGYDHNWVLNSSSDSPAGDLKIAAILHHPTSGRTLTVHTTEPGIQFYAGNFLTGALPNRDSTGTYARRTGLCLETQHFPDSPNHPTFPTTTLHPHETFRSTTIFAFSTE